MIVVEHSLRFKMTAAKREKVARDRDEVYDLESVLWKIFDNDSRRQIYRHERLRGTPSRLDTRSPKAGGVA